MVLLDSLRRDALACYGGDAYDTPHLDRFASSAVRFDDHHAGSLPCMPARHDILVGSLDFLWRPWGSIEVWEQPVTVDLRGEGVVTMLISDHPHLFEVGGENYHTDFAAWEYHRGSENDPWRLVPDPTAVGAPRLPGAEPAAVPNPYDISRTWFSGGDDLPAARTMRAAADWVRDNAGAHDRWFLFVDEFDPHEPFDTPEPFASRYDSEWTGPKLIWPPYDVGAVRDGRLPERAATQLRASYGAAVSFIDEQFGRLLDSIDANTDPATTAVIVCTDHGLYLGDTTADGRDVWGKPGVSPMAALRRIPLLIRWPGVASTSVSALTTTVDLHATLLDAFGVELSGVSHGRSVLPLLDGRQSEIRPHALCGMYGRHVQVITPDVSYARSTVHEENLPLSLTSNRWSTLSLPHRRDVRLRPPDGRARLDVAPGTDVPVIRQPFECVADLPYWARGLTPHDHHLYQRSEDPDEQHDLAGRESSIESGAVDALVAALEALDAPSEQYERLGLR